MNERADGRSGGGALPIGFAIVKPGNSKYHAGGSDDWLGKAIRETSKLPITVGIILILLGSCVLFSNLSGNLYAKILGGFVVEVGFAFIISFVVIVALEHKAKYDHDRMLTRNFFSYIYENAFPVDAFRSIERNVFQSKFVRDLTEVDFEFADFRGEDLLLRTEVHYLVRNVSPSALDYSVRVATEKPLHISAEEINDMIIKGDLGLSQIWIEGNPLTEKELKDAKKAPDEEDFFIADHVIKDIEPDGSRSVRIVNFSLKDKRDSEFWRTRDVCLKLIFKVRYPETIDVRSLIVCCGNDHKPHDYSSNAMDSIAAVGAHQAKTIRKSFEINDPLLPKNGVFIWWAPKADRGGSSTGLDPEHSVDAAR